MSWITHDFEIQKNAAISEGFAFYTIDEDTGEKVANDFGSKTFKCEFKDSPANDAAVVLTGIVTTDVTDSRYTVLIVQVTQTLVSAITNTELYYDLIAVDGVNDIDDPLAKGYCSVISGVTTP